MDNSEVEKSFPIVEPNYTGWSDEERFHYIKWMMAKAQRIADESRKEPGFASSRGESGS